MPYTERQVKFFRGREGRRPGHAPAGPSPSDCAPQYPDSVFVFSDPEQSCASVFVFSDPEQSCASVFVFSDPEQSCAVCGRVPCAALMLSGPTREYGFALARGAARETLRTIHPCDHGALDRCRARHARRHPEAR